MGKLTTHVLDTSRGRPAAGMTVRLYRDDDILVDTMTNADGRCDNPLLAGDTMLAGTYRLEFDAADYFRDCDVALPDPAFLDVIVIHFGIADAESHYHVPLLVSPYAYSAYRGS